MKASIFLVLSLLPAAAQAAGSYVPQASFAVPVSTVADLDTDSVGNLYALGLAPGATTYGVSGYRTPALDPLFSFDTGLSSPAAFAVEPSGIIDVLDTKNGYTLLRYTNPGTFVGQVSFSLGYAAPNIVSTAIDKYNARLYIAYQYTYHPIYLQCLGCGGPSSITKTTINQYDLQGNLLTTASMPGSDATPGSCYTPTKLAVDAQGELYVADQWCGKLLKFDSNLALSATYTASSWSASFAPRAMWSDAASSLYISQPVCGPTGCPPGIVKLAGGSLQTSLLADSPVGCAWDQRILYVSAAGASPVKRYVFASPLSVPAETAPMGTVVQHSSAAAFGWQASSSAEGDPIVYSVLAGTAPTSLQPIGSASQPSFTSAPLAFGTTYFWQVSAQSSYLGLPVTSAQAPVVSFNQNLRNSPPFPFAVAGGTGTVATRSTTAALLWQNAGDPDGDPLVYDVFWRAPGQSSATLAGSTSGTSWSMTGLAFGSTYYWSVRARDVYGVATWLASGAEQPYAAVFANTAPPAPVPLSGTGVTAQHTWTPQAILSWSPVDDPDGDPVSYRLLIGTSASSLALAQDGQQRSYLLSMTQGTTYFWQVAAYDPYGGTSASALQSLQAVIQNQPPAPFAILSGTGTIATRSATLTLAWADAADPDGDAVTYDLAAGTSSAALSLVQSSPATSFSLGIQLGATYYWQVTARDGFGGAQASGIQTMRPVFKNSAPSAPGFLSGSGTILEHTSAPQAALSWSGASDPDGDPVAYRCYFGTAPAALTLVQDGAGTVFAAGGLQFETTYYWQAAAYDPYGAASTMAVQSLLIRLANQPPAAFAVLSGTGAVSTRASVEVLSWSAAADPDGDAVGYRLYFGTAPSALSLLSDGNRTSSQAGPLAFGTTYYWRVDAYDTFGAATPMNGGLQSLVHLFRNSPPAPIVYLSTASVLNLHTGSPTAALSWAPTADPEGDPVSYELDLSSGGNFSALALSSSTALTIPLTFDVPIQWRVLAADPFGGVSTGAWLPLVAHLSNQAPNAVQYLGAATLKTRSTSYLLTWVDSGDPDGDPVLYRLDLGVSSAALAQVQMSFSPAYLLPLQFGTTVYYRVTAQDPFGASSTGGVQTLLPVFLNDPPQSPNVMSPFKSSPVIKTMKNAVTVSWEQVTNPENDPISYTVYFGNSAQSMALLATISQTEASGISALWLKPALLTPQAQVQTDGSTIILNLTGLDYYRSYYLQVTASNPYGATSFAPVQSFSLASGDGFPKAYNYPNPFSPNRGGTQLVFNAPPSGYAKATVEVYSEWQDLLFKQDYFNIPPGISQVHLDGRDRYGRAFFNGSYVCRVRFSGPEDKETFYLLVVK